MIFFVFLFFFALYKIELTGQWPLPLIHFLENLIKTQVWVFEDL